MIVPRLPEIVHPATGDEAALRRLVRFGGTKLLDALAEMFMTQAPQKIAALREALAAGDVEGTEDAAHSLKSSSAQLGAPALTAMCQRAEATAHDGRLDGLDTLPDAMTRELDAYTAWYAALRPTMESS